MAVGLELIRPKLPEGRQLGGETVRKLFKQKIIYVIPERDLDDEVLMLVFRCLTFHVVALLP